MTTVPRKPTIITSGLDANLAHALQPVKDSIEMITGAKKGQPEIVGLSGYFSISGIVRKINEIVSRINASGTAKLDSKTELSAGSSNEWTKPVFDVMGSSLDWAIPVFNAIYPVGAIYIGVTATCPIADLGVGTWTLVAQNLSLQGSGTNAAGSIVAAGLPNITGGSSSVVLSSPGGASGAFANNNFYDQWGGYVTNPNWNIAAGGAEKFRDLNFDASLSNSIYGASNTVQPPAYVVNVWQRTA